MIYRVWIQSTLKTTVNNDKVTKNNDKVTVNNNKVADKNDKVTNNNDKAIALITIVVDAYEQTVSI